MNEERFSPLPPGVAACLCPRSLVPAGLGECIIEGSCSAGALAIVRADPVIAVSGVLLTDWHDAVPPGVILECQGNRSPAGDVIRIEAGTARAVYVVTRALNDKPPVWEARWPD